MLPKPIKTEVRKGSLSRPLKKSSHDSDKPQKKKGPDTVWVRPIASRGNSDKQKESSKGKVERVFDSLKVPVRQWVCKERAPKPGGKRSVRRPASVTSGESNHSTWSRRSVNNGNGSAEGVHAAGVLPDSVHQNIFGEGQLVGDTASITSRKSDKSTGSRHSVHSSSGKSNKSTESEYSVHQDGGAGGNDGADDIGGKGNIADGAASKGAGAKNDGVEDVAGADDDDGDAAQGAAEKHDTHENHASKHREEKADIAEGNADDCDAGKGGDAGEGEGGDVVEEGDGDGDGEEPTSGIMVIRERK